MNKDRRLKLKGSINRLNMAKISLELASDCVDVVQDGESDAMDNVPESLQSTDRYYTMEETVDALDDILSDLSDMVDKIDEISQRISEIAGG